MCFSNTLGFQPINRQFNLAAVPLLYHAKKMGSDDPTPNEKLAHL